MDSEANLYQWILHSAPPLVRAFVGQRSESAFIMGHAYVGMPEYDMFYRIFEQLIIIKRLMPGGFFSEIRHGSYTCAMPV
jgi:hypothetical protein